MVIGLSYSAWKLSVPSMHLVFCMMLCVHNMLSKHTMAWSANQSRYGMVNNILHTGIIMFCSPWGKQKPGRTAPSLRLGACWDGCIGRGWANNSHLPAAGPAFLNGLAHCTFHQHIWSIQEKKAQHPTYAGDVMPCSGLASRALSKLSIENCSSRLKSRVLKCSVKPQRSAGNAFNCGFVVFCFVYVLKDQLLGTVG